MGDIPWQSNRRLFRRSLPCALLSLPSLSPADPPLFLPPLMRPLPTRILQPISLSLSPLLRRQRKLSLLPDYVRLTCSEISKPTLPLSDSHFSADVSEFCGELVWMRQLHRHVFKSPPASRYSFLRWSSGVAFFAVWAKPPL